jgi:hypothetical protein
VSIADASRSATFHAFSAGEELIEQERALDREFAEQNISLATLPT